MPKTYTFAELCQALKKSQVYVRNLQTGLDMYVAGNGDRYTEPYVNFMQKVVALRTLNISIEDIRDLFIREKRIMEMLHADTATDSPTWYLDGCEINGRSDTKLFLTSYDLGVPVHSGMAQANLNFQGHRELFTGPAMGENVREFCQAYCRQLEKIKRRIQDEKQVLRNALAWAERAT
jgi:hypothetical protein